MSLHDYKIGMEIAAEDNPFNALIMAAMRQADTINGAFLKQGWPKIYRELRERYNAPGGFLDDEEMKEGLHQRP